MTNQQEGVPQQDATLAPPNTTLQPGQAPCPHCRRALEWSPPNNQWFCRSCNLFFAPGGGGSDPFSDMANEFDDLFGNKPKYYCNTCGAKLYWTFQFNRWHLPQCHLLNWNVQYNRWHCGRCQAWK